jgi:hypothetical protein
MWIKQSGDGPMAKPAMSVIEEIVLQKSQKALLLIFR